jgi:hypothetical protein
VILARVLNVLLALGLAVLCHGETVLKHAVFVEHGRRAPRARRLGSRLAA